MEFLPEAIAGDEPVIFDPSSGVLGISKRFLQKAYVSLRKEYTQGCIDVRDNVSAANSQHIMNLTLVVLLQTTENLNAINTRKRILQNSHFALELVRDEIRFLNILFSSPLQKHTKSPMLWQHRKWLLQNLESHSYQHLLQPAYLPSDTKKTWFDLEFEIILKAGELHTKNYYAWAYARWLLSHTTPDIQELSQRMFHICKQHVSDISMWSFLLHILLLLNNQDLSLKYAQLTIDEAKLCPNHESMWHFIRIILAKYNKPHLLDSSNDRLKPQSKKWISHRISHS